MTDAAEASLLEAVAQSMPRGASVGVAVSGGGDSMALLDLVSRSAGSRGWGVRAATVDHGLRPEAADEARMVAQHCADLGIPHETLVWRDPPSEGNLQDRARRARRRLLTAWARREGIGHVALGHTEDDLAETFLMRLSREAGLDGLSAMRADWQEEDVCWHRPLLAASREALRDYLRVRALHWVEDPSNDDPAFARVRARSILGHLQPLGLTGATLASVARNLGDARAALARHAAEAAERIARVEGGDVVFGADALRALPAETRRRLLIAALRWVSGAEYPPREAALDALWAAVGDHRDHTLSGCLVLAGGDVVRVTREAAASRGVEGPTDACWDGRWRLDGPHAPDLRIAALGEEGLRHCPDWRESGVPRASLRASPAVWRGADLVAAPLAGLSAGWSAQLAGGRDHFASYLLSH
ncbi:tRNA(Ile)-lysidine synthase [Tranquillimonas rosea]|uniref:tRNA(Ile)-lysidine synthase n=1 Tax=Tranquillimonas rosea TaxID=641238 RepID=A0A1H9UVG2_9RHOB|nr:tRNA lysidine(34) synthetase TilS [Tranquillimonas rosea]SES13455.1 tRNA(Ile)-lysidine synthase [Tranquillimonas rosea]